MLFYSAKSQSEDLAAGKQVDHHDYTREAPSRVKNSASLNTYTTLVTTIRSRHISQGEFGGTQREVFPAIVKVKFFFGLKIFKGHWQKQSTHIKDP